MSGFGNGFETEALPGALLIGRNSPQRCAYGLYAEQLSGSPFTAPRTTNERSWLYRIRPTAAHWSPFRKTDIGLWCTAPAAGADLPIAPQRWDPIPVPTESLSFVEGVRTITTAGDARSAAGMGAHIYLITRSMQDEYFYNADGEMLFVPQEGELRIRTEFGIIDISPGEIAVIPRGVKILVELRDKAARGHICENYGGAFSLPERGPIGANCLANPRDFLTPVASFEDKDAASKMYVKWGGSLWIANIEHSPLDVAWHARRHSAGHGRCAAGAARLPCLGRQHQYRPLGGGIVPEPAGIELHGLRRGTGAQYDAGVGRRGDDVQKGWSVAATFEGELAAHANSYAGKGAIRYQW